jgi:oligoribonuclease NrnB/cAMP/cGMP phosphodiesterase (DHH superfamily)
MQQVYVLYRAGSVDGLGAKYAAWIRYQRINPTHRVTYVPVQYNQGFPELNLTKDDEVYIFGFYYPKVVLDAVAAQVKLLVVRCHHQQALADLSDAQYVVVDQLHSGCVSAWLYFHPGRPLPKMLMHIQDQNLWVFAFENTREVISGLYSYPDRNKMPVFDKLVTDPNKFREMLNRGKVLVEQDEKFARNYSKPDTQRTAIVTYKGLKIGLCNTSTTINEICNAVSKNMPVDFAMGYYILGNDRVVFELRSSKDGNDFDVCAFAQQFGGGGQHNAAGFQMMFLEAMTFLANLYHTVEQKELV